MYAAIFFVFQIVNLTHNYSTFSGKTAYDLSTNNSLIQNLIEKYLSEVPSKENIIEPIEFAQKNILVDTISIKSLGNSFEIPPSIKDSRESHCSPLQNQHTGIYDLIWPEPKCIIQLGHVSPPFIVGKELLISIIQVCIDTRFLFF